MKLFFIMTLALSSHLAWTRGPMPHERQDTPKKNNTTTGRYFYVGDVPKFEASELEITISKMSLTTRVTAFVTQGRIDTYARQLFMRWKTVSDAMSDPILSVHPLVKLSTLAEGKNAATRAWSQIAEQYSSHQLEDLGINIFSNQRNASHFSGPQESEDYKQKITEAYFRYLFNTRESSDTVINDNRKLENLLSVTNSRRLFNKHLGHLHTASNSKRGYVGELNFVYPIAATVKGPFGQPKEMITDLITAHSMESRWWSNMWADEFGGFPFLLIEWSGVAFHGPISNNPMDVWFLRRGYVSHGCHRMDGSDLLEMRALMPSNLTNMASEIKVIVLDFFDVIDFNKTEIFEAVDVKYYNIPISVSVPNHRSISEVTAPFLVENQARMFFQDNQYARQYYDADTDTLRNIPRYNVNGPLLTRSGTHERVGIRRFDYRPNRIIQYTEENSRLLGFDDNSGKYPPRHFQKY